MTVGNQATNSTIDQKLTSISTELRDTLQRAANLNEFVNGQGAGTATLEALGYSAGDAATALTYIGYLTTLSQLFNGTTTQGSAFNFGNALAPLWAGQ